MPFSDNRCPYAAELRISSKRQIQPVNLRIRCDQPVYSAATVIERLEGGKLVEGYAFEPNLHGEIVTFAFSEPALTPDFYCHIEVRGAAPVGILAVEHLREDVPAGTIGLDIMAFLKALKEDADSQLK